VTAPTPGTPATSGPTCNCEFAFCDKCGGRCGSATTLRAEVARLRDEVTQPRSKRLAKLTAECDEARAKLAEVRALAEGWRYKGEFGWGPWQEGYGPDQDGMILDGVSAELLQILDAPATADPDTAAAQQPYQPRPGTSKERQEVGDPGHCEDCLARGHVAAHPDLGCGDVGCSDGHDPADG
jgi:hypothetical protein